MDRLFVPEFRMDYNLQELRMSGHASVFGALAPIGGGWERIHTRAFDAVLERQDDVRFLLNHNPDNLLGRTTSGTLQLGTDDEGLAIRNELPDTQLGRDVRVLTERRDLTGMSFGFVPGEYEDSLAPDGRQLRTHMSIQRLYDVSLATYPAYEQAEASLRTVDFSKSADRRSQLIRVRSRASRGR